jgi:alanine dehydrogenase
MKPGEMLVLTSREIQALLSLDDCIGAVEDAFRLYGEGKASPPGVLSIPSRDGGFHLKAGSLELHRPYFAAKVNGNFPNNGVRFGLPTIQGVIVLCDSDNGTPLAVMDSRAITSLRTGAATAVAAKCLARRDSQVVTICGCGNQGRVQLKAISLVCRLRMVFAYDIRDEQALRFADEQGRELKVQVKVVDDLAPAVRQSDICVTCTPTRQPLLDHGDVRPGTFIAAVGADNPEKHELHPALMTNNKIVCDMLEQCAGMGELHHALAVGAVTRADVFAELGEIVAGKKQGRESDKEIIIFDSTGMALQDVAAAALLYEKAQRNGSGVRFDFAA